MKQFSAEKYSPNNIKIAIALSATAFGMAFVYSPLFRSIQSFGITGFKQIGLAHIVHATYNDQPVYLISIFFLLLFSFCRFGLGVC